MGWVDGKPKMVSERIRHLDFGAVAAVWGLLSDLGVTAVIDEACGPAPSGLPLSVGTYLALAVLNRVVDLSLIHISEPTRLGMISYAVFCLKKKKSNRH